MLSMTLFQPELPPVLHGLNFEIKPGEKVGILGRRCYPGGVSNTLLRRGSMCEEQEMEFILVR